VLHVPGVAGFAYAEQAFRIQRKVVRTDSVIHNRRRVRVTRTTDEVVLGVTSLYPEEAGPDRLLDIARKHWTVEVMHNIRDVSMGEDRSRASSQNGPRAVASLRSLAVSLIRAWGFRSVPDGQLHYLLRPDDLLDRLAI
jgi:hypothetical protein